MISSTGFIAIAENSSLSTILPGISSTLYSLAIASTAAVPVALIAIGVSITLASVVWGLYNFWHASSARTLSALNLDFSPFLWEIELWDRVQTIVSGYSIPASVIVGVSESSDSLDAPKDKRSAIVSLFSRLDIQFAKFCESNLSAATRVRKDARGDAEWISVIDSTIEMYKSIEPAMSLVRETSIGTSHCQHRLVGKTVWMPVMCVCCRTVVLGIHPQVIVCLRCRAKMHVGCVLQIYKFPCVSRDGLFEAMSNSGELKNIGSMAPRVNS